MQSIYQVYRPNAPFFVCWYLCHSSCTFSSWVSWSVFFCCCISTRFHVSWALFIFWSSFRLFIGVTSLFLSAFLSPPTVSLLSSTLMERCNGFLWREDRFLPVEWTDAQWVLPLLLPLNLTLCSLLKAPLWFIHLNFVFSQRCSKASILWKP